MSQSENSNKRMQSRILGAIHDSSQWSQVISALSDCKYYAYIFHDHDEGKEKHLHFVAEDRHNLDVWSRLLGIPTHMIELPKKSWRGCNRYLIHKDDSEKFLYNPSDVITNKPIKFQSYLEDNSEVNPKIMFYDLAKIKQGRLSVPDFIDKYNFQIYKMSFYSQFKIYKELMDLGAQFDDFVEL